MSYYRNPENRLYGALYNPSANNNVHGVQSPQDLIDFNQRFGRHNSGRLFMRGLPLNTTEQTILGLVVKCRGAKVNNTNGTAFLWFPDAKAATDALHIHDGKQIPHMPDGTYYDLMHTRDSEPTKDMDFSVKMTRLPKQITRYALYNYLSEKWDSIYSVEVISEHKGKIGRVRITNPTVFEEIMMFDHRTFLGPTRISKLYTPNGYRPSLPPTPPTQYDKLPLMPIGIRCSGASVPSGASIRPSQMSVPSGASIRPSQMSFPSGASIRPSQMSVPSGASVVPSGASERPTNRDAVIGIVDLTTHQTKIEKLQDQLKCLEEHREDLLQKTKRIDSSCEKTRLELAKAIKEREMISSAAKV